jgi:hypothetical protein
MHTPTHTHTHAHAHAHRRACVLVCHGRRVPSRTRAADGRVGAAAEPLHGVCARHTHTHTHTHMHARSHACTHVHWHGRERHMACTPCARSAAFAML